MSPIDNSVINTAGRNALVTSLIVCCGFVVCWSPVEILFFVSYLGYPLDFGGWPYQLLTLLAFTNSCINPFIYAAKYREFQRAVRRLRSTMNQQQSQVAAIAWYLTVVSCSWHIATHKHKPIYGLTLHSCILCSFCVIRTILRTVDVVSESLSYDSCAQWYFNTGILNLFSISFYTVCIHFVAGCRCDPSSKRCICLSLSSLSVISLSWVKLKFLMGDGMEDADFSSPPCPLFTLYRGKAWLSSVG